MCSSVLQHYAVQYTDTNLPMEGPAKAKLEVHVSLKYLVSIYQTTWCHNPKTTI